MDHVPLEAEWLQATGPKEKVRTPLRSLPPVALTVGSALADEVPVELVVDVDLHVVHPGTLQEEHRVPGDGRAQSQWAAASPDHSAAGTAAGSAPGPSERLSFK